MIALPSRWKTTLVCAFALSTLVGCGAPGPESRAADNVQVVTVAPRSTPRPVVAAPATAVPIAKPSPKPTALSDMQPHKTFVDPPLPPELRDDGGLRPLPPPPAR